MILPHRLATESLSDCWEYDEARRVLELVVRGVGLVVPVCAHAAPRVGAYPIVRLDARGAAWKVVPICFDYPPRGEVLAPLAVPYPLADDFRGKHDPDEFAVIIDLESAPTDIARALERL